MLTLIESELTTDWLSCHLCTDTCQHVRHLRHKHSLYPGSDKTDSGNIHQNLGSGSGQNIGGCDGHILLGNGTYLGIWILSSSTYRPIDVTCVYSDTSRSSCRVYFTRYFQTFWKNLGFLKMYGANMGPNAKKLTKNSI